MKVNDFLAVLTSLIVLCMQIASGLALWLDKLSFADYAAIWTPVLTLVLGYWFRGVQAPANAT